MSKFLVRNIVLIGMLLFSLLLLSGCATAPAESAESAKLQRCAFYPSHMASKNSRVAIVYLRYVDVKQTPKGEST